MRKKPDELELHEKKGSGGDTDDLGALVFEIRLKAEPDEPMFWSVSLNESFIEGLKDWPLERRQEIADRMLYMAEQSITEGLGVKPQ
jgi:hypothetical protein